MLDIIDGSGLWVVTSLGKGLLFLERVLNIDVNPRVLTVGVNSNVYPDFGGFVMVNTFTKDPNATLDYRYDWASKTNGTGSSDWLAPGETISSFTIIPDTGITVVSSTLVSGSTAVVVFISGGTDNTNYQIECQITTSLGKTDERSIYLKVREIQGQQSPK